MTGAMITLFWASVATIVYAYVVYPLVVGSLSRLFGQSPRCRDISDGELPCVSLLIAAHNEEAVIGDRIAKALAMDYPGALLEIVVASDGSDDATASIVRGFANASRIASLVISVNVTRFAPTGSTPISVATWYAIASPSRS